MSASITVLEHLSGPAPGTPVSLMLANMSGLTAAQLRFRSDDGDGQDTTGAILLPVPLSLQSTQPITGNLASVQAVSYIPATLSPGAQGCTTIASQTIQPPSGRAGIKAPGPPPGPPTLAVNDYLIVDPGNAAQEVVQVTMVSSTTGLQLMALFGNNHNTGVLMLRVVASFAKVVQLRLATTPKTAVSNVRFAREMKLPTGVFDQYQLLSAYQPLDDTPWITTGAGVYPPVPLNIFTLIAPGIFTKPAVVTPFVAFEWLFSGNVTAIDASAYRWTYDES
jgi:hypothetical protein